MKTQQLLFWGCVFINRIIGLYHLVAISFPKEDVMAGSRWQFLL